MPETKTTTVTREDPYCITHKAFYHASPCKDHPVCLVAYADRAMCDDANAQINPFIAVEAYHCQFVRATLTYREEDRIGPAQIPFAIRPMSEAG